MLQCLWKPKTISQKKKSFRANWKSLAFIFTFTEKKEIPIREKFTSVFEILIYLKMPEGKEGWGAWGEEGKKNEREAEKVGAENLQREEQFDRLSPCLSNFKRHSLIFFFS